MDPMLKSVDGGIDWNDGACGVSHAVLEQLLKPAVRKTPVLIINVWGGGNITEIAMVCHLLCILSSFMLIFCCLECGNLFWHTVLMVSAASRHHIHSSHEIDGFRDLLLLQRNGRAVLEFVRTAADVEKGLKHVKGMNFIHAGSRLTTPDVLLNTTQYPKSGIGSNSATPNPSLPRGTPEGSQGRGHLSAGGRQLHGRS